jgi:hypothetical protein
MIQGIMVPPTSDYIKWLILQSVIQLSVDCTLFSLDTTPIGETDYRFTHCGRDRLRHATEFNRETFYNTTQDRVEIHKTS